MSTAPNADATRAKSQDINFADLRSAILAAGQGAQDALAAASDLLLEAEDQMRRKSNESTELHERFVDVVAALRSISTNADGALHTMHSISGDIAAGPVTMAPMTDD